MASMPSDMDALKTRLKATWMAGDYGHFATYLEPPALEFLAGSRFHPAHSCWMSPAGRDKLRSQPLVLAYELPASTSPPI